MMFGLVGFLMNMLLPDSKRASVSLLSKILRFYQKLGVWMLLRGLLYTWLREQKYRGEKGYGMKNRWEEGRDEGREGGRENGKELIDMHIETTIYKDVNYGFYILVFNSLAFCQELIVTHTHTHTHREREREMKKDYLTGQIALGVKRNLLLSLISSKEFCFSQYPFPILSLTHSNSMTSISVYQIIPKFPEENKYLLSHTLRGSGNLGWLRGSPKDAVKPLTSTKVLWSLSGPGGSSAISCRRVPFSLCVSFHGSKSFLHKTNHTLDY